jgi:hypothetical protein
MLQEKSLNRQAAKSTKKQYSASAVVAQTSLQVDGSSGELVSNDYSCVSTTEGYPGVALGRRLQQSGRMKSLPLKLVHEPSGSSFPSIISD